MAGARFLAENFFDTEMFTSHTVTAEEEATNHEVTRVAGGRRAARDYWTSTTANSSTYVQVACDRARAADFLWIDRGHNLDGHTLQVSASHQAAFTTTVNTVNLTVPTNPSPWGSDLTNANVAVRTPEGAIMVPFGAYAAPYWRIIIPAMGAGLTPRLVGAMLGKSWSPTRVPRGAFDDDAADLSYGGGVSALLQRTAATKAVGRRVTLNFPLQGESEYSQARYHIRSLYAEGYPMLVVPDTAFAERAFLAAASPGLNSMPFGARNARELSLNLPELDPALP